MIMKHVNTGRGIKFEHINDMSFMLEKGLYNLLVDKLKCGMKLYISDGSLETLVSNEIVFEYTTATASIDNRLSYDQLIDTFYENKINQLSNPQILIMLKKSIQVNNRVVFNKFIVNYNDSKGIGQLIKYTILYWSVEILEILLNHNGIDKQLQIISASCLIDSVCNNRFRDEMVKRVFDIKDKYTTTTTPITLIGLLKIKSYKLKKQLISNDLVASLEKEDKFTEIFGKMDIFEYNIKELLQLATIIVKYIGGFSTDIKCVDTFNRLVNNIKNNNIDNLSISKELLYNFIFIYGGNQLSPKHFKQMLFKNKQSISLKQVLNIKDFQFYKSILEFTFSTFNIDALNYYIMIQNQPSTERLLSIIFKESTKNNSLIDIDINCIGQDVIISFLEYLYKCTTTTTNENNKFDFKNWSNLFNHLLIHYQDPYGLFGQLKNRSFPLKSLWTNIYKGIPVDRYKWYLLNIVELQESELSSISSTSNKYQLYLFQDSIVSTNIKELGNLSNSNYQFPFHQFPNEQFTNFIKSTTTDDLVLLFNYLNSINYKICDLDYFKFQLVNGLLSNFINDHQPYDQLKINEIKISFNSWPESTSTELLLSFLKEHQYKMVLFILDNDDFKFNFNGCGLVQSFSNKDMVIYNSDKKVIKFSKQLPSVISFEIIYKIYQLLFKHNENNLLDPILNHLYRVSLKIERITLDQIYQLHQLFKSNSFNFEIGLFQVFHWLLKKLDNFENYIMEYPLLLDILYDGDLNVFDCSQVTNQVYTDSASFNLNNCLIPTLFTFDFIYGNEFMDVFCKVRNELLKSANQCLANSSSDARTVEYTISLDIFHCIEFNEFSSLLEILKTDSSNSIIFRGESQRYSNFNRFSKGILKYTTVEWLDSFLECCNHSFYGVTDLPNSTMYNDTMNCGRLDLLMYLLTKYTNKVKSFHIQQSTLQTLNELGYYDIIEYINNNNL